MPAGVPANASALLQQAAQQFAPIILSAEQSAAQIQTNGIEVGAAPAPHVVLSGRLDVAQAHSCAAAYRRSAVERGHMHIWSGHWRLTLSHPILCFGLQALAAFEDQFKGSTLRAQDFEVPAVMSAFYALLGIGCVAGGWLALQGRRPVILGWLTTGLWLLSAFLLLFGAGDTDVCR